MSAVKWTGGNQFISGVFACFKNLYLCSEKDELQFQKTVGSQGPPFSCAFCAYVRRAIGCADSVFGKEEVH